MNQWSRNRKRIILAIVIIFVVGLIGLPAYLIFYKAPTCFDGKLNGDETGVDCGGSCQLLCSAESVPLLIKGDPRVLTLAPNTFQVVALVENSNNTADIYIAGYTIKVYAPGTAVPVKVIEGETYVPKGKTFTIFEGPFALEVGINPTRATLEWDESSLVWQKNDYDYPELVIKDKVLSRTDLSPRLEATVENVSFQNAANIDFTALITDVEGNIFAASKTFVGSLSAGEDTVIVFTWPRPFTSTPVGTDIVVRIFPDRSFIR
ncbi:MAG: hypothetical protein NUV78_00090 [Candidatus Zambryskibacteria bacterium]|nr:hypothetical protein [Candidatus Zambryskibacteria bacterium]